MTLLVNMNIGHRLGPPFRCVKREAVVIYIECVDSMASTYLLIISDRIIYCFSDRDLHFSAMAAARFSVSDPNKIWSLDTPNTVQILFNVAIEAPTTPHSKSDTYCGEHRCVLQTVPVLV